MSILRGSLLCVGVWLLPGAALAGNGLHPRTPVVWNEVPCMTVVDRSTQPVLHLDYDVPLEDTDVTTDEVDDSRRHQFLAFCRQHSPQDPLPQWVSQAGVDAAVAKGLISADSVPAEDILDSSPQWSDCFVRITPDDERRAITFSNAAEGVDWDTTGLARGAYTVEGFTWEPPYNLYSSRGGVVKVVDDVNAVDNPPAAAITSPEIIVMGNETAVIDGCIDAAPGSTITAQWAFSTDDVQEWTPFVEDEPVNGEGFQVEFTPPRGTPGNGINIRVIAQDPLGQSYTAYMADSVIVLLGDGTGCGDTDGDGGGFIGNPGCDLGPGASSGSASDGDSGTTGTSATAGDPSARDTTGDFGDETGVSAGADDPAPRGCSCAATPSPWAAAWLLVLAPAIRRRRSDGEQSLSPR